MELVNQRTKKIMEDCKVRAISAGLSFQDESLEYIVTNRDLLDLSPKNMIPTLYDYWVHDLQVFKERKMYEFYPFNPYETVINTRPAISFYNDNNPDWLNVMIFYHVLAHIDFFQNNSFYKHTWNDDFCGVALADKRLIARLRSEKGRWADYIIEFTWGIDNLVGFHHELSEINRPKEINTSPKVDFYFDIFLSKVKKVKTNIYLKEIDRYNECRAAYPNEVELIFFSEVNKKSPEFEALYQREMEEKNSTNKNGEDLIKYISEKSKFLNQKENLWLKSIIEIVRRTSLYFEPQRRTNILNEGWASYWHDKLFLEDDRIKGHEVDFAAVNSKIMSMPRAGLNPYALGWRMLMYIEELADKGKISYEFEKIKDVDERKRYDKGTGKGLNYLFYIRENYCDFTFVNDFIDQDFVNKYNLFVVGRRLNSTKGVWEYYVKSRDAHKYKKMLVDSLYHPPNITVEESKVEKNELYLYHHFEGRPLVKEYIENTMLGIEYLWGEAVHLETREIDEKVVQSRGDKKNVNEDIKPEYRSVLYTMKEREI